MTGIGELLRQARVAKGISQESLARELRLPLSLLMAIEMDQWAKVPPGRERPLTRMLASKVDLDLEEHGDAFEALPGGVEQVPVDPRRETLERVLMGVISLGTVALFIWLVVPGQGLKSRVTEPSPRPQHEPARVPVPRREAGPYPILGEVLPEAPVSPEGIRVSLRAMDTCEARITGVSGTLEHSLRISEPWSTRVKGPFTLFLDNAGVADIEVAGRHIQLDRNVGESWTGSFDVEGRLILPSRPKALPVPTAPETDPDVEADVEADDGQDVGQDAE